MINSSTSHSFSQPLESMMAVYVLGLLDDKTTALLTEHYHKDPDLSAQLAQYQALMGILATFPPAVSAPDLLRARLFASLLTQELEQSWSGLKTRPDPSPTLKRWMPQVWWRGRRWAIALLGGGLLLWLGMDDFMLRQRLTKIDQAIVALQGSGQDHALQNVTLMETTLSALQGAQTHVFRLHGTPVAHQASGSVILDLQAGVALVALQNLPPLPQGQAYHLWAFTADQKIRCGVFNTSAEGKILDKIAIAPDEFNQVVMYLRISKESTLTPPDRSQKALVMTSEI